MLSLSVTHSSSQRLEMRRSSGRPPKGRGLTPLSGIADTIGGIPLRVHCQAPLYGSAAVDVLCGVCPLHLLLLNHALADHLVHRGFNKGRADRLAVSVAFAKVRDELLVVADVGSRVSLYPWHLLHHLREQQTGNAASLSERWMRGTSHECYSQRDGGCGA